MNNSLFWDRVILYLQHTSNEEIYFFLGMLTGFAMVGFVIYLLIKKFDE